MKIYRITQSNQLVISSGFILYHGTLEEFDFLTPRVNNYDKVFWTTEYKQIAKAYIPIAGAQLLTSTNNIAYPSLNEEVVKVQKKIGIDYDSSTFKIEGYRVTSYRVAPVFCSALYMNNLNSQEEKFKYVNQKMVEMFDNEKNIRSYSDGHVSWRILLINGEPASINERETGKLLTIEVLSDLKVFDMTFGGKIDGDLTDVDYHKVPVFRKAEESGYDAIKINDYAQSHNKGNYGHTSVGIFKGSLNKIKVINVEDAKHEDL